MNESSRTHNTIPMVETDKELPDACSRKRTRCNTCVAMDAGCVAHPHVNRRDTLAAGRLGDIGDGNEGMRGRVEFTRSGSPSRRMPYGRSGRGMADGKQIWAGGLPDCQRDCRSKDADSPIRPVSRATSTPNLLSVLYRAGMAISGWVIVTR